VPGGPRGLQNRCRFRIPGTEVGSIPILSALVNCGLAITDCGLQNVTMTTQELKNRTFEFGVRVISAVEALPKTETARILGRQLLRAGTSVGANYRAAARAKSQADFISKLGVVEEECDESAYWMEVIVARKLLGRAQLKELLAEANELLAITGPRSKLRAADTDTSNEPDGQSAVRSPRSAMGEEVTTHDT
jgi:four helix bundle protein